LLRVRVASVTLASSPDGA